MYVGTAMQNTSEGIWPIIHTVQTVPMLGWQLDLRQPQDAQQTKKGDVLAIKLRPKD